MDEQSHLEEMRAAIRGDRERAERRRQTLENVLEGLPVPESQPEAQREEERPRERRRWLGRR